MLDRILAHKRAEIQRLDLPALQRRALDMPPPRDFLAGLRSAQPRARPALIAELKRASPSRGILALDIDLTQLARIYAENGAAALSVLTDEAFFYGSLDTLRTLSLHAPRLPLLRKDFILSTAQVYESRAAGADAILLIASILDEAELRDLCGLARELGMAAMVEVHSVEDLERALSMAESGDRMTPLIGINNRDLRDFSVSLDTTVRLRPLIPDGVFVVAESGIRSAEDVARLAAIGVDAILVGEALVTAPDIGAKVRELAGMGPGGLTAECAESAENKIL